MISIMLSAEFLLNTPDVFIFAGSGNGGALTGAINL